MTAESKTGGRSYASFVLLKEVKWPEFEKKERKKVREHIWIQTLSSRFCQYISSALDVLYGRGVQFMRRSSSSEKDSRPSRRVSVSQLHPKGPTWAVLVASSEVSTETASAMITFEATIQLSPQTINNLILCLSAKTYGVGYCCIFITSLPRPWLPWRSWTSFMRVPGNSGDRGIPGFQALELFQHGSAGAQKL